MKRCSKCHISKPPSGFGYQKKSWGTSVRTQCKECRVSIERARYQTQTEEQKTVQRDRAYRRLYGITIAEYNMMFNKQEGRCPGCSRHQSQLSRRLSVDHNHSTGAVRALLCHGCNMAIGYALENTGTLRSLAAYLESVQ